MPCINEERKVADAKPFYILAPMDDVTDVVFRDIIAHCAAPDLFMTEFVNVDGLQSAGRTPTLNRLRKRASEHTTIAQLWGKNPQNYLKSAQEIVEMGFAGIDINMGCPDKTVVKNGCCSAFILPDNRNLACEVIAAVKEGVAGRIPVSVKTRLGFNEVDYSWHELLLQQKVNMLTIHARTRKEMSKVPADWSKLEPIVALRNSLSPDTMLVGNGDVMSRSEGDALAKKHGLDGVMIGRGIFSDPYVFAHASPWESMPAQQKIALYKKQVELFAAEWPNGEKKFDTLKRFAKVYVAGFDGASDVRVAIMECKTTAELIAVLSEHI